jgi:hypothetical protein
MVVSFRYSAVCQLNQWCEVWFRTAAIWRHKNGHLTILVGQIQPPENAA